MAESIPRVLVVDDENFFREALRDILTGERLEVLEAELGGQCRVRPDHGFGQVEVIDAGSGMDTETVARAFERFEKGPDSPGSGLGLAIARRVVELHESEIRVSSQVGVGTRFSFDLAAA